MKNKTLITLARAMLDDYGISQRFWAKAINTACHASNRVYLHRFSKKSPYDLLIGRKPNISYFWVFGCKCYIFKKRKHLGKFESRCDVGFLVGYWAIYIPTPSCEAHLSCTPNSFPTSVLPLRRAQFAHLYPNRRNPHVTDKWVPPHRKYIHRGVSLTSGPHKNYHSSPDLPPPQPDCSRAGG